MAWDNKRNQHSVLIHKVCWYFSYWTLWFPIFLTYFPWLYRLNTSPFGNNAICHKATLSIFTTTQCQIYHKSLTKCWWYECIFFKNDIFSENIINAWFWAFLPLESNSIGAEQNRVEFDLETWWWCTVHTYISDGLEHVFIIIYLCSEN